MKIGYADPPYIGCAHMYADHPDFGGEVDHAALIHRLETEFDGWVLHTSATKAAMAVLARYYGANATGLNARSLLK